jgi:hypothetical protein
MKIICGIYKIINPKGKIYIGQSIDILCRWRKHKNLKRIYKTRLYNSLKKYGIDKHKFEIIHECLPQQLNKFEKYYVDLYQTFNTKHGLNIRNGGGNTAKISEETILKMSKKVYRYNADGILIKEYKSITDAAKKTNTNISNISGCCNGKEISANNNYWSFIEHNIYSPKETIRRKETPIINQYSINGILINSFKLVEIEEKTNYLKTNIVKVCRGKQITAYGYIWKYSKEENRSKIKIEKEIKWQRL